MCKFISCIYFFPKQNHFEWANTYKWSLWMSKYIQTDFSIRSGWPFLVILLPHYWETHSSNELLGNWALTLCVHTCMHALSGFKSWSSYRRKGVLQSGQCQQQGGTFAHEAVAIGSKLHSHHPWLWFLIILTYKPSNLPISDVIMGNIFSLFSCVISFLMVTFTI